LRNSVLGFRLVRKKGMERVLFKKNKKQKARCRWPMPVILDTQQIEIRRIAVPNQPGQIVRETLSQKKKKSQKIGLMKWLKVKP
jgi:hypothetical protein